MKGIDQIWSADLVDMQAFSKWNKGIRYLLSVIDVFSKYAWVAGMRDKTGQAIIDAFHKMTKTRKPQMLWVDRGTEFYNRTFRKWLEDKGIKLYSTEMKGRQWSWSVSTELSNRTCGGTSAQIRQTSTWMHCQAW